MSFIETNNNPLKRTVGDCVVRAISLATGKDWDTTYIGVITQGFALKDMPSSNNVWGWYLFKNGFDRFTIPNTCPECYTVKDFCEDHPKGIFVLATGSHVVPVIDGNYYDTWDSGEENPVYYWERSND